MTLASSLLALLAGALSTLSPCVLPLLPLVLGAAVSQHRFGPMALAAGLALSFVAIGLFIATIGFSIGIDGGFVRGIAALLMLAMGVILMVPTLQTKLAVAGGPVSNWAEQRFGGLSGTGLQGQFGVGLLLGAVWSPCVGPTLGAASILAAQGKDLGHVALTMVAFGVGAAIPLLILGMLSREAIFRVRDRLLRTGRNGKAVLGAILITVAVLIFSGWDRQIETVLVNVSPAWLTHLTTQI
jgi:cytochrome c-type biogenesis protein